MIIARLMGGLGNQLFQYACARRLSLLHNTNLKLDLSWFEQHQSRAYALGAFSIQEEFATPDEIAQLKGTTQKGLARIMIRLGQKLKPYYKRSVFAESHLKPFDPNILNTPKDLYLEGYWQSEKYFADIEDTIRREFTLKTQPDSKNRRLAEEISRCESVSIHIRRGDFATGANRTHGTLGLDYYNQCINLINEKTSSPCFFVFSDDPSWAKENLRIKSPTTFVTQNAADKSYEDLRLMSLCKHNVTANSSFSWWGAWLNPNPDKIVMAPKKWFNDPSLDAKDLLPDQWITV